MANNRTITVHEVLLDSDSITHERICNVRIEVDGRCTHSHLVIHDPFEEQDAAQYSWYLEEWSFKEPTPKTPEDVYRMDEERQKRADERSKVRAKLEGYGRKLHKALNLQDLTFVDTVNLHIDICEAVPDAGSSMRFGIHRILWETLEQPNLWKKTTTLAPGTPQINVMVRRIVSAPPSEGLPWESRRVSRKSPLRILLVVARKLTKTEENEYADVKAGLAQIHLLSVQQELAPMWYSHQIELDIVRPGSYDALERRLQEERKGYFDLVHFDLHGNVEDNPK
jgi:hypothetical protein